jgi:hypothetical protein
MDEEVEYVPGVSTLNADTVPEYLLDTICFAADDLPLFLSNLINTVREKN